jgi:hypothetical protein
MIGTALRSRGRRLPYVDDSLLRLAATIYPPGVATASGRGGSDGGERNCSDEGDAMPGWIDELRASVRS